MDCVKGKMTGAMCAQNQKECCIRAKDIDCCNHIPHLLDEVNQPLKAPQLSCGGDRWGCSSAQRNCQPDHRAISGAQQELSATVIPATIMATNTTTCVEGTQCAFSSAERNRWDNITFSVTGDFDTQICDCQQTFDCEHEDFHGNGTQCANFNEKEGKHCIDSCNCHGISGKDLMGFETEKHCLCGGKSKSLGGCHKSALCVSNPEKDIEEKINNQIYKTIGGVLSDIVKSAISSCVENTIHMEEDCHNGFDAAEEVK